MLHLGQTPPRAWRRRSGRVAWGVAFALGACVAAAEAMCWPLPPAMAPLPQAANDAPVWIGSFHVHSARSHDSRLTPAEIARAARAQGLDFVVLTDHDVPHRAPEQLEGVLLLFEREASTSQGHAIILGEAQAAIVAHPTDSHRPWTGPLCQAPGLRGLEIATLSSTARRVWAQDKPSLLASGLVYPWRPQMLAGALIGRDDAALALWDGPQGTGLAGLCGVDAHGWMPLGRNLSLWRLVVPRPDTAVANSPTVADAPALLRALHTGHSYCAAAPAGPRPVMQLWAEDAAGVTLAQAGQSADAQSVAALHVGLGTADALPAGAQLHLYRDGVRVHASATGSLIYPAPEPGAYRVELWGPVPRPGRPHARAPLIYSNRISLTAKS